MDDGLKAKLQGAEISLQGHYMDKQSQNITIFVNPTCDIQLNEQEIQSLRNHLVQHGVSIDNTYRPGASLLPENNVRLIDRNLSPDQLDAVKQSIREAFADIDPEIEDLKFMQDPPKPSCEIPIACLDKSNDGRSA